MSLILDALQKADQERKDQAPTPSLDDNPRSAQLSHGGISWKLIAGLVLLFFIGVGTYFAWSYTQHKESAPPKMQETAPPFISDVVAKVDLRKPTKERASSKNELSSNHGQGLLAHPQRKAIETTDARKTSVPIPAPDSAIAKLYDTPPPSELDADKLSVSIQAQAKQAGTQSRPANQPEPQRERDTQLLSSYTNIGSIKELPLSIQEKIPTLIYSGHTYEPQGHSEVILNGKPYRERSNIDGDIVIEKILKDGILLKRQDNRFKLHALNSWLNF